MRTLSTFSSLFPALLALTLLAGCAAPKPTVTVLTQNLYLGFDALALLERPTPPNVEAAFADVAASNIAARARALVDAIADAPPDLIALQEMVLYRTQTPGDLLQGVFEPNATTFSLDFVSIIIDALDTRGLTYAAITAATVDVELPGIGRDIRLSDRDVILVRTGPDARGLTVLDVERRTYAATYSMRTLVGPVPITRGWVAADVELDGATFRIVTTTLESLEVYAGVPADVQEAQAAELASGPLATDLPVLFAGDVGSAAAGEGFATAAYGKLIGAGFDDAWAVARPDDAGFTCCQQPGLSDPTSALDVRLDVVLYRGGFEVTDARLIGAEASDVAGAVRWPSDHAGVLVTFELP